MRQNGIQFRPPIETFYQAARPPTDMFGKLGTTGIAGVLLLIGGLAVVALESVVVAGGLALMLVGLLLVARGLVGTMMSAFGMDGMF